MDLLHKKVLVLGLARTGVSTVRFLSARGARVKVSEMKPAAALKTAVQELRGIPVEYEWGGHTLPFFRDADLIVVSPGAPMDIPVLAESRNRRTPVISEVELAFRFLKRPLVAVTGTNGKTTTTTLIGAMLRESGRSAFVGGNIGTPLIDFVQGPQAESWAVAEISSFQLEGCETFRPRISVLLNLTEDHLDRYRDFAEYIAAKGRVFSRQEKDDYAVLNADDPETFSFAHRVRSQVLLFSAERRVPVGCFLEKREVVFLGPEGDPERFGLNRWQIRGAHNLENLMAAVATARLCGCSAENLQRVIDGFQGLEHRLEFVRKIRGVSFYNDSKGTNVGSVVKSLMSFPEPVWLIAGGKDKGGDYGPLRELIAQRVKGMALIGEAQDRIDAALGRFTETVRADTLEEAVKWAFAKAVAGDVVLLSPACSSYDMFENYQERGRLFKAVVHSLDESRKRGLSATPRASGDTA